MPQRKEQVKPLDTPTARRRADSPMDSNPHGTSAGERNEPKGSSVGYVTKRARRESHKAYVAAKNVVRPVVCVETTAHVLSLRRMKRMERMVERLDRMGIADAMYRDIRFHELRPKTGWSPLWPWTDAHGQDVMVEDEPGMVYDWWCRLDPRDRSELRRLSTLPRGPKIEGQLHAGMMHDSQ